MKFRDLKYDVKDWWDDRTEEAKMFAIAVGIFAAGILAGAWVF